VRKTCSFFCSDVKPHKTFKCLMENKYKLSSLCTNFITEEAGQNMKFFGVEPVYTSCESNYPYPYYYSCSSDAGWAIAFFVLLGVMILYALVKVCIWRRARRQRMAHAAVIIGQVPSVVPVAQAVPIVPLTSGEYTQMV